MATYTIGQLQACALRKRNYRLAVTEGAFSTANRPNQCHQPNASAYCRFALRLPFGRTDGSSHAVVGENDHAFFNCDLHGVLKFSQVVGVVPWYLPLRFGRGAEVSPRWNLWGVAFPPGITNIFKKIASLTILDGFESYIHLWIGNDVYNFTKIAAILNFHVNMPPSWILCVF